MKTNESKATFYLAFSGQDITVTTNIMTKQAVGTDGNGYTIVETVPLFYEGVLLDSDSQYLYLGKSGEEITQAVNIKNIVHVMVTEEDNVYDEILNKMPEPTNEEIN